MSINTSGAAPTCANSAVILSRPNSALDHLHPVRLRQAHRHCRHRRLFRPDRPAGADRPAVIVGLLELIGGIAILVGFQTRIAAYVLAMFTVASALVAHTGWADQIQMIHFLKNLAIAGGFLVLASSGPGAYSIDAKRG